MRDRPKRKQELPRWAEKALRRLIPCHRRDVVLGDFAEIYGYIAEEKGRGPARRWLLGQVLKSLPSFVSDGFYFGGAMLKNYLKISIRNLKNQKGYAFINVSGLALGIACCLLIFFYVQDELSYDRMFPNAERIYRVAINEVTPTSEALYTITPYPLAATLAEDYAEVVHATRLRRRQALAVRFEDRLFDEQRIHRADSNFFDVFQLPFLKGDPQTALVNPSSVVITASTAKKYFGEEEPLGKVLEVKDRISTSTPYTVTGVIEDLPRNVHFDMDFLLSWWRTGDERREPEGWFGYGLYTYFLLDEQQQPATLEAKFPDMLLRYGGPQFAERGGISLEEHLAAGNAYDYSLQPLTDIHLHSNSNWEVEPNGSITYVYLFVAIALFILVLACVNYMNLATARAAGRFKEIGMRKVLGSSRRQLIAQVLTESFLTVFLACLAALVLAGAALPTFNAFTDKTFDAGLLGQASVLLSLLALLLGVGLLAGSYPAFFLSAFRPAQVLKGQGGSRRSAFRNGLVVFQFVICIALLVGTLVVQGQMDYMLNVKLGFNEEHVVVVDRAWSLAEQRETFKQELEAHPSIVSAAIVQSVPGRSYAELFMAPAEAPQSEQHNVFVNWGDHDYPQTMGLELARGRLFDPRLATDSVAVVVNEALVRVMSLVGDGLGERIRFGSDQEGYPIIGVVKDFHFQSLHDQIQPLAFFVEERTLSRAVVRIRSDDVPAALAHLEATWAAFVADNPFKYSFLEEDIDALYRAEQQTRTLFGFFFVLAILIACLGLFGLSAFVAERRTKEIGVRKAMGATVSGIVLLLSKDFVKLVGVSFVLAVPFAYVGMTRWLEGFAYHIDLSWATFLLAGGAALLVALLAVSYQSIKAARANPMEALRYE